MIHYMISDVIRRAKLEFTVELPMLAARKWTILFGLCFQYVHGIFGQLAHEMHRPMKEPLHDLGFTVFKELGKDKHWVSELLFGILFLSFILWSFSPFYFSRKRFYTFVLYARVLNVIVICQTLRILSFTSTQLPAPNYHCRLGEPTAVIPPYKTVWDALIVNVERQSGKGCGDLIFSSHTTFALVQVLAYNYYGSFRPIKILGFSVVAVLSCLIIASRKHYTVDITVAWYTVPLVFYAVHARTTNSHLRDVDSSAQLLPVTSTSKFESDREDGRGDGGNSSQGLFRGVTGSSVVIRTPSGSRDGSSSDEELSVHSGKSSARARAGSSVELSSFAGEGRDDGAGPSRV